MTNMLYWRLSQSLYSYLYVRLVCYRPLVPMIRYLHEDKTGPNSDFKKRLLQRMKKNAELKSDAAKEKEKASTSVTTADSANLPKESIGLNLYGDELPIKLISASKDSFDSSVSRSPNKDGKVSSNEETFEHRVRSFVESALFKRGGSKRQRLSGKRSSKKLKIETEKKLENEGLHLSKTESDSVQKKPVEQSKTEESLSDEISHAAAKAELARSIIAFRGKRMTSNVSESLKEPSESQPNADQGPLNASSSDSNSQDRMSLAGQAKSKKTTNRRIDRDRTSKTKKGFERFMNTIKGKSQQAPERTQTLSDPEAMKTFVKSRCLEYISKTRSRSMKRSNSKSGLSKANPLQGTKSNEGISTKSETEPKFPKLERNLPKNKPMQSPFETPSSTVIRPELDTNNISNISNKDKEWQTKSKPVRMASSDKHTETTSKPLENTSSYMPKVDEQLIKAKKVQNLQSAKRAKEAKSKSLNRDNPPHPPSNPTFPADL